MSDALMDHKEDGGAADGRRGWTVIDKNARQMVDGKVVPRVHEIVPGQTYALFFNQPVVMPEAHARRFLKDASFEVRNPAGELLVPLSDAEQSRQVPASLDPDQVVAKLGELTREALTTRVALLPGAPKFNKATSREDLIEFIVAANKSQKAEAEEDLGLETMSGKELDRVFAAV